MGKLISKTAFIFAATFFFAGNVHCGPPEGVVIHPSFVGWRAHLEAEIEELRAVPPDARDYKRLEGRKRALAILNGELDAAPGLVAVFFMLMDAVEEVEFKNRRAKKTKVLRTEEGR